MKKTLPILFGILFFSLVIRLALIAYHTRDKNFHIQQDHYSGYAHVLLEGKLHEKTIIHPKILTEENTFNPLDERLFPGLPFFLIPLGILFHSNITAGVLLSITASLVAIYLFWVLSKNMRATFVFSFFPPVWVIQGTKVATEPITTCFCLLALFLYQKKRYLLTGIILGVTYDIRIIAVCLVAALCLHAFLNKQYKPILFMIAGFVPFVLFLLVYNYVVFNKHLFTQSSIYASGPIVFGGVQIILDLIRAIDWKQYRIFASGLLYVLLNLTAVVFLFKKRKSSPLHTVSFYWAVLSLLFIFSVSPNPLLEDFARYASPITPAVLLGIVP